ncbi:MAG TPA: patatin-like phospholipase family protein [Ramlibacter sp.]|uniref:patatin-like phospholipase family protein n=1 Tax=Ramlibacter sp. TaxID=1917967 RepID=UPI002D7FC991|nr:patatin-like phospholipase family protein [Ramlibacter sp.]HET8747061.1 patatin-like phospholipase family protein [Ramlibacter sp.]
MQALRIYAGPAARRHIAQHGLAARDVGIVPAAAGGPKGLVLGPLDRFLFGQWLPATDHTIHLVGASIGAWRMATACLHEPVQAFERLERDYIAQHYDVPPGRRAPTAAQVSKSFAEGLEGFFGGRIREVLEHPRFRLHIVTARGRHLLRREHRIATPLGYLGAFLANTLHRRAMGAWLERVVFSAPEQGAPAALPFGTEDFPTRQVALTAANFQPALQASCSIPFLLQAVHDIPGAPRGAYWDGGITDYHLHLKYASGPGPGLVLYPHFQQAVVPGWLDKGFKWRHRATSYLDRMVVLAPDPQWVRTLPNAKLPDRTDFTRYGTDLQARIRDWTTAAHASRQLAEEFAAWLERPDPGRVEAL